MTPEQYRYISQLPKDTILDIVSKQQIKWPSTGLDCFVYGNGRIRISYVGGRNWDNIFEGFVSQETNRSVLTGAFKTPPGRTLFYWVHRCLSLLFLLISLLNITPGSTPMSFIIIPLILFFGSFVFEYMNKGSDKMTRDDILKFFETELQATCLEETSDSREP